MTKLNCYLDCEHEIEWGESPEAPGAALPRVGQIVYCPECEEEQEIEEIKPSQVIVETLECATRKLHVLYDAYTGTWGWCIAVEKNGIYAETEDITGFESPEAAKEAGLTCYKKGGPNIRQNT